MLALGAGAVAQVCEGPGRVAGHGASGGAADQGEGGLLLIMASEGVLSGEERAPWDDAVRALSDPPTPDHLRSIVDELAGG